MIQLFFFVVVVQILTQKIKAFFQGLDQFEIMSAFKFKNHTGLTSNLHTINEMNYHKENISITNSHILALDEVASVHYHNGRYDAAVEALRAVYELRKEKNGSMHTDTLSSLNNLASALGRADRLQEAEATFREVLRSRMQVKGPTHLETFITMNYLGAALKQLGQFEEADTLLYIALEGFHAKFGTKHIFTAECAYTYAILAIQEGRKNKAAYLFDLSFEGLTAILGSQHQHTKDAWKWTHNCLNSHVSNMKKLQIGAKRSSSVPFPRPSDIEGMDNQEDILGSKKDSWVSESQCSICSVAYSIVLREHHCRVCGCSACDPCSSNGIYMAAYGMKSKSRCCNTCAVQGFN